MRYGEADRATRIELFDALLLCALLLGALLFGRYVPGDDEGPKPLERFSADCERAQGMPYANDHGAALCIRDGVVIYQHQSREV